MRVHHGGRPDEVFYESGTASRLVSDLRARGHAVQEARVLGLVSALSCPDGVRDTPGSCQVVSDPRGRGIGQVVQ